MPEILVEINILIEVFGGSMDCKFSWLHISDLHVGVQKQNWLWPNLKDKIYEDIEHLIEKNGSIDLVIFTGDLTQRGSIEEFGHLTKILTEFWALFKKYECNPYFFCVPGNHDLSRPNTLDPLGMVLGAWWDQEEVQEAFWKEEGKHFRNAIESYFKNYTDWLDSLEGAGIPLLRGVEGLIPGDVSSVIELNGVKLGLVGFNSAWLQLSGREYNKFLNIDPRQLSAITDNAPTAWAAKNDINLLITHHPLDWLHPESVALFNREVDIDGRFDLHLFGHMHTAANEIKGHLGMSPKRTMQASSLFGLEYYGDKESRVHGYSVSNVSLESDGRVVMKIWPRASRIVSGSERMISVDMSLPVNKDNYIEHVFHVNKSVGNVGSLFDNAEKLAYREVRSELREGIAEIDLNPMKVFLSDSIEHYHVRVMQQTEACKILQTRRWLWLVSDWGMREDAFISAVQKRMTDDSSSVFEVKLGEYTSRKEFYEAFKQSNGFSFEAFCGALADDDNPYLLLSDVPFNSDLAAAQALRTDLDNLVSVILSFCPSLKVVLVSRQAPPGVDSVEISALDQADTKAYIDRHPLGGNGFTSDEVLQIFSHTDGVPQLIDDDLSSLSVASLREVTSQLNFSSSAPGGLLERAILDLAESEDAIGERAYLLLKLLTVFPQGEMLDNIKNLDRNKPFFPPQAELLKKQGFIYAQELDQLDGNGRSEKKKRLVATRAVREWMLSKLPSGEKKRLFELAAKLYFGDSWATGEFRLQSSAKYANAGASASEIDNARAIIQRMIIDAKGNVRKLKNICMLISNYATHLIKFSYYRGACDIFHYVLPMLESDLENTDPSFLYLRFLYGRSIRMLDGEDSTEKALEMLLDVLPHFKDKSTLVSINLNLALCYQFLDEDEQAKTYANMVLELDKKSPLALNARQILIEVEDDSNDKSEKLRQLEIKARKQGANIVATNMALSRAQSLDNPEQKRTALNEVVRHAHENKDTYNYMRSKLAQSELTLSQDGELSDRDQSALIKLYHYLYNERFDNLFNRCHKVLWANFIKRNDYSNLLQLFRFSSLLWRLRGLESQEAGAVKSIKQLMRANLVSQEGNNLYMSYFNARSMADDV